MAIIIDEIIELVSGWRGKKISVEPLSGGMTNSNYKIVVNGSFFFVSIPGGNSRLLGVDWYNKFNNARICGEAGLSPKVVQGFPLQKVIILEFLPLALCSVESLQRLSVQHRLIQTLKVLHGGASFLKEFDMFCLIQFYLETIKNLDLVPAVDLSEYRARILETGEALAPYRQALVPCHNDLVPENVMDDGNRVFLLDFDYSGNNDPCFDLGSISVEAGYNDTQVRELARAYYGLASETIMARIHLHGILGDVGWSLWSVIQAQISDIDFDFKAYGLMRWNRAVEKMESSEFDTWLRDVRSRR
ncbi:MAG: phosphotransferase [Halieaceae bacterium]|nr:phosphotransferase [Halieaceae bacterium]